MEQIAWGAVVSFVFSNLLFPLIVAIVGTWVAYRWQHKRDVENLRLQFKHGLDNDREMRLRSEIVPSLWKKVTIAGGELMNILPGLLLYPELNEMHPAQLNDFLKNSKLNEFHKNKLRESTDKTSYYRETVFWYQLAKAENAIREFHNSLIDNRIWLSNDNDLKSLLNELDQEFSEFIGIADMEGGELPIRISAQKCFLKYQTLAPRIEEIASRYLTGESEVGVSKPSSS